MVKSYLTRKEKIIINAIDILDQGGINGLTMKEIANQQGITEPAVYRQFKNKQEIVLTILERFAAFDETLMNTIRQQDMTLDEAIHHFFTAYVTYYQNYPAVVTVLFSYDVYRYEPMANGLMTEINRSRNSFIAEITQKAIEEGLLSEELSGAEYAQMLLGQLWSTMYQWKLDECRWDLKDVLMKRIEWMLDNMKTTQGGA